MTIYLDLLFILNVFYDFLILLTVSITLKRNIRLRRIVIGSLFGGLTTFLLLLNISNILLLGFKLLFGIIMILITFKYKNIKYVLENITYLYMISIILAGFLYYLSLEFDNANYLLLVILSPLIFCLYIYEQKKLKIKINYNKKVKIILKNDKVLELDGFIDSGNRLRDPVTKKYIILINKNMLDGIYNIRSPMYVPVKTINKRSLIECITVKEIVIDNKSYNNYLVGLSNYLKDNCECLLNYNLLEENL